MSSGPRQIPEVNWHCQCTYDGPTFTCHGEDVEWEYDPQLGEVGRGYRDLKPEQVADLFLYKPFDPWRDGDIVVYDDSGNPTDWVWQGFEREENGKHYMIAFERPVGTRPIVAPERPMHYYDVRNTLETS